jgi:sec-independent protein translocase protein TatA
MFSQIGPLEIILVLAIALIVLGPKRLPDAGRSVGRGLRNFRSSLSGDDNDADDDEDRPALTKAMAADRPADERKVSDALRRPGV